MLRPVIVLLASAGLLLAACAPDAAPTAARPELLDSSVKQEPPERAARIKAVFDKYYK